MPRQAETQNTETSRHLVFRLSKRTTKTTVVLRDGPKLERVIQFIEPSDFQPLMTQVF